MARILVATVPLTGHVQPMVLVVRALVERGHDVVWYGSGKFGPAITKTGARHARPSHAVDWDDADVEAALPALRGKRGLARVRTQLDAMFIAPANDQLRDLEELADAHAPEVVLADQAHLGAAFLAEKRGLPWVSLGISALGIPSVDTAPFGTARPPVRSDRDRSAYRVMRWLVDRVLFRATNRAYREARHAAGLPEGGTYFSVLSPDLYLQPTVPAFEYPRSDLPAQVKFIGPLVPARMDAPLPAWWSDVLAARERGAPVILVTQGTLATAPDELIVPALAGLASLDALVVATTPKEVVAPPNARVAAYVPYEQLLAHASVMVTNGGYGGVQMALRAGVPLVIAGGSEEKPEIAARVAWSGVGVDLRTRTPKAKAVRAAVDRVLADAAFGERTRAIAAAMAEYDAPTLAALELESVVARRAQVAA